MTSDIPLQILGGISAREFLRDYWQKKPLLIRQAIPSFESPVSPDELAGLSLEEEVESRMVIEHGDSPWELRRGPFGEDTYQDLPERNWTLLVQAVDQLVPEVADLIEHFRFLPNWRIDDVMISFAAPGGGVGPHYDNYDVFLLQAQGQRRWRVGQMCDSDSPLLPHADLRILADFQGTAEDPHQIQSDALQRLRAMLAEHMGDERLLLTWFGQFMTEPRYPERVQGPDIDEQGLLSALDDGAVLVRNLSARLAWSEVDIGLLLFASGQSRLLPAHLRDLLKLICSADALHAENLAAWLGDEDGRNLVWQLVKQGSLEFADE